MPIQLCHGSYCVPGIAFQGSHLNGRRVAQVAGRSLFLSFLPAAKLVVEMSSKTLTEKIQCKWVDTGVAEA